MKKLLMMIGAVALGSSVQMPLLADTVYWKADAGGDITSSSNWTNSLGNAVVPAAGDVLDFSAIVTDKQSLTGSFPDDRVFSCAMFGGLTKAKYVTLNGSLHFETLTNANSLAIGATGSLVIDGDLVWQYSTAKVETNVGRFLFNNEGSVTVNGIAMAWLDSKVNTWFYPFRANTASHPLRVKGVVHKNIYGGNQTFMLSSYGSRNSGTAGELVIGSEGLSFDSSQANQAVVFQVGGGNGAVAGADVTLYSSDDWKIGTSNKNKTTHGDLYINGKTLTIDTADYDYPTDATKAHTVTLNGRIYADATSGTSLSISGNGTFVVATKVYYGDLLKTCISNTVAVIDSATLQVNADASYEIANVNLAAGTTLSLPSSSATALAARSLPSVTLPAEGKAYLRIDGPALKAGEYTVLDSVPSGYASHLSVVGTAIGTRSVRLSDDGSSLKLIVPPKGLIISFF